MAQGSEEPPFLRIGTEVSAKYRGAFCEASIKTVKKHVKCKIQYKDNSTATLTDDVVKGDLKIGSDVVVKTLDGRSMDGVIIKLTDASTYTVVFDDGDERTLRRSSLCLKGGRHFNESETLDHLPLTDPENFGTPVIQNGKKRKKRRPSIQQSSFDDGDSEKEECSPIPTKKKCLYNDSIVGKVVIVERGARRKSHWFPALGVSPNQENLVYMKSKDNCLARSFKDGNYHVINVRDTKEFSKDQEPVSSALKSDSRTNKPGIERAIAYLETGRVPSTWEGSKSEVITYDDTDDEAKKIPVKVTKAASSDDDNDESSDDDVIREAFVEKLQTFMEKQGTPIIRNPVLGNQDLDLHKLYLLVMDSGGMEEVTKKQEWRNIYAQMGIAIMPPSASHHIKMAYKKYLYPYELHDASCRTTKQSDDDKPSNKKEKGTIGRTRLERNSKTSSKALEKPADNKRAKPVSTDEKPNKPVLSTKPRRASTPNKPIKQALSPTSNKPTAKPASTPPSKPNKLPLSSSYNTPAGKQATTPTGKSKSLISRQSSKSSTPDSHKESIQEIKEIDNDNDNECRNGSVSKQDSEDGRRSYKREDSLESDVDVDEDVTSPDSELAVDVVNSPGCMSDTSESRSDTRSDFGTDESFECTVGDKIQVKYGKGRNRRMYEAKIVTVDPDAEEGLLYLIHYTGWNTRYDEWVSRDRIIGKSNKASKKKGPAPKEVQKNKIPPKPPGKQIVRSLSKRGTKSPSPASPSSKPSDAKPANGNKSSLRASPPLQQPASPSSAKQTAKNGTTTRRTRSDRNSFSSNGLEEAVKSPPTKRRQKSLTPEPPEQPNPVEISKENPEIPSTEEPSVAQETHSEPTEPLIKEENIKIESPESPDNDNEEDTDEKAEPKSNELVNSNETIDFNSKLRPWSKLPNGIISYSSSESGSPEHSASENDLEPANKKVKVEKEFGKEEIEKLLSREVEGKEPISAPYTQGSCTSDTQNGSTSSTQDDRQKSSSPVDSEQQADSTENNGETKSNSSEAENSKEEKTDNKEEDDKTDKKDSDNRGKRQRKKKERKRSRHHSVNENSNDGCSSNASPSSKSSPTRPKICFSADLESIKSMEDRSERIRLLQLKINEMRKLYGSLKAEVASIDRRRKKFKKKREESASSNDSKSNCVSSPATVECR